MVAETDLALEEFKTLRKEISDKMDRSYKILSLGVGGITIILGFVFEYEIYKLFFILPLLILANSYLHKSETISIVHAGSYIKKIENSIYRKCSTTNRCNEDKIFGDMGWENYLERKIYKLHEYAADAIFSILYFICVAGAWEYNQNQLKNMPSAVFIIILYVIIGLVFFGYNIRSTKS